MCGEINKDNEKTCYCCGNKYEKVFSFDFTRLLDELELEKKQLIEDKKEEILTDEDNKKSKKPLILIVSSAVVLLIILALFISPKNNKSGDTVLTEIRIGDTVNFGWYEQDNNTGNGKEEIEWLVLDKEGKDILLMSYYALDCQQYNTINEDVTWETCSLRKWLNNDFLNTAFDTDQQSMIKDSLVKADANPYHNTSPGNDTTDKVFLLSLNEVREYSDYCLGSGALCEYTAYSKSIDDHYDDGYCAWWLRTPGGNTYDAVIVNSEGEIREFGFKVESDFMIRPVIWLSLEGTDFY